MKNLAEANRYINSFPRPAGLNTYAWAAIKRMALKAWECYLTNRKFTHSINFMSKDFYMMIRTPEGKFIVPENQFSYDPTH